jgi:hypothetical protein
MAERSFALCLLYTENRAAANRELQKRRPLGNKKNEFSPHYFPLVKHSVFFCSILTIKPFYSVDQSARRKPTIFLKCLTLFVTSV